MTMRKHKIDKVFKEKLGDLSINHENDLWSVVEQRIPNQRPQRWWYAAAGGALMVLAISIYLLTDSQNTTVGEPEFFITETPQHSTNTSPEPEDKPEDKKEQNELSPRKDLPSSNVASRSVNVLPGFDESGGKNITNQLETSAVPLLSPVKGDLEDDIGKLGTTGIKRVEIKESTRELPAENSDRSPIVDGLETALKVKNGTIEMPDVRKAKDSLLSMASSRLWNKIQKLKINNRNEEN